MASSPFLVLPLDQENTHQSVLFSLEHDKPFTFHGLNLKDNRCVGSSHGWLAILDENSNPYLFNPFSSTRINLPEKHTLPHYIRRSEGFGPLRGPFLSKIDKVVLCRSPSRDYKNCVVVVMYSAALCETKVAFCRPGDERWSPLESGIDTCYDVVCCDRTNTVFVLGPGPAVESWDFNELIPRRKMIIKDSCPIGLTEADQTYPSDLYTSKWYLVSSMGEIFLVVRFIGEFVRYDGQVVYEADTFEDYNSAPLVCPYRTVDFDIYKIDFDRQEWIEVESLKDYSIFVGGNQSTMVPIKNHQELKKNCIYFTDDYWDRMNEDDSYGGHDMGVFDLEDGSIEAILEDQEERIEPPPFWINSPHDHEHENRLLSLLYNASTK